jgi:hypothetical protein
MRLGRGDKSGLSQFTVKSSRILGGFSQLFSKCAGILSLFQMKEVMSMSHLSAITLASVSAGTIAAVALVLRHRRRLVKVPN